MSKNQTLKPELHNMLAPFVTDALQEIVDIFTKHTNDISLKDEKRKKEYLGNMKRLAACTDHFVDLAFKIGLVADSTPSVPEQVLRALMESSKQHNDDYDRRHPGADK